MKGSLRYSIAPVAAGILMIGLAFPNVAWGRKKQNSQNQTTTAQTTKSKKKHRSHKKKAEKTGSTSGTRSLAVNEQGSSTAKTRSRKAKEEMNHSAAASGTQHAAPAEAGHRSQGESTRTSAATSRTPPSAGMVWVSKGSKVYHQHGSRYYGNTKQGQWMTPQQAQKAGYRAAKN